jgi:hypothetical protein
MASSSWKVPISSPSCGKGTGGLAGEAACLRRALLLEVRTTVGGSEGDPELSPSDTDSFFETALSERSEDLASSEICIDSSSSEWGPSLENTSLQRNVIARLMQRDVKGFVHAFACVLSNTVAGLVVLVNANHWVVFLNVPILKSLQQDYRECSGRGEPTNRPRRGAVLAQISSESARQSNGSSWSTRTSDTLIRTIGIESRLNAARSGWVLRAPGGRTCGTEFGAAPFLRGAS